MPGLFISYLLFLRSTIYVMFGAPKLYEKQTITNSQHSKMKLKMKKFLRRRATKNEGHRQVHSIGKLLLVHLMLLKASFTLIRFLG